MKKAPKERNPFVSHVKLKRSGPHNSKRNQTRQKIKMELKKFDRSYNHRQDERDS